jgi:hypothetical protein
MARPPRQPSRTEVDPEELPAFDRAIERATAPDRALFIARQQKGADGVSEELQVPVEQDAGYYGRLLLSPQLAYHLSEIGRIVRATGDRGDSYTHAEREFVDQVHSADMQTNVIQRHHIPDAVAAGVRIEAIDALRSGREHELDVEERELAAFIRQVVGGGVDDATWESLEQRKGERWMVEYPIFILFLQLTMRLQQVVGMPEPSDEEIDRLVADLRSGARDTGPFVNRAG